MTTTVRTRIQVPPAHGIGAERLGRLSILVLILASFPYWQPDPAASLQDRVSAMQIATRILPLISLAIVLLASDVQNGFRSLRTVLTRSVIGRALVIYAVVACFATIATGGPLLSIWKSMEVLVVAYVGGFIASWTQSETESRDLYRFALWTVVWVTVATLVFALMVPSRGFRPLVLPQAFGYVAQINPNQLGFFALIGCYFLVPLTIERVSTIRIVALVGCTAAFFSAQSRSAFFAAGVVLAIVAWRTPWTRGGPFARRGRAGAGWLMAGVLIVIAVMSSTDPADRRAFALRGTPDLRSLVDLSGRTPLWRLGAAKAGESPAIGFGIGAASRSLTIDAPGITRRSFRQTGIGSVHNSPLEMVLGAGVLGSAYLLLVLYGATARAGWAAVRPRGGPEIFDGAGLPLGIALVLCARSLTSAAWAVYSVELLLMVLAEAARLYPWQARDG